MEIVDPYHRRFRLHEPRSDFMTFYGTLASGVGPIVPRQYPPTVGEQECQSQTMGLAPYRASAISQGSN